MFNGTDSQTKEYLELCTTPGAAPGEDSRSGCRPYCSGQAFSGSWRKFLFSRLLLRANQPRPRLAGGEATTSRSSTRVQRATNKVLTPSVDSAFREPPHQDFGELEVNSTQSSLTTYARYKSYANAKSACPSRPRALVFWYLVAKPPVKSSFANHAGYTFPAAMPPRNGATRNTCRTQLKKTTPDKLAETLCVD